MALRLGFKIYSFLKPNRTKFPNADHIKRFSSQNQKLRYTNQPTKSGCTLTPNQVERKLRSTKVQQISIPISTQTNFKTTEQTVIKPEGYDMSEMPIISSDLQNTSVTIRRKFAKSSTQNAITQPLKMPRLANPFPEPVKTLPSDTVSDEEKARQMQEQVKMEARYHLQMQQEMLLQQKLNKMSQKQNIQLNNNKVNEQPQVNQQMNYAFQQPQQMNIEVQPLQQPNFRKPKRYGELQHQELAKTNDQEEIKSPRKYAINTTEQNADDIKQKRPRNARCRRKAHTRAARYLRHSWYPRGYIRRQMREYSTSVNSPAINPDIITVSEQCDLIIRRLKTLYPEYKHLKKPILIPGSTEEKEFLKNILKLIGKLKSESDQAKRLTAPFPSYSEVKTFKFEPRKQQNNITNKDTTNTIIFNPGSYPRFYSTRKKNKPILIVQKPMKNKCPKFKLQGFNPNQYSPEKKDIPIKREAPYPAYSEICDDSYESVQTECKLQLPLRSEVTSLGTYKTHNKSYSTTAGDFVETEKKEAKKKPPCKSPFPPIPQCDYAGQAEKNKERKRKKHCPKNKDKKCKAESVPNVESRKIISKIKSWLNAYKPDKENIKITRSPTDIDGRETYIIDVCEYHEITTKHAELDIAAIRSEGQAAPEIVEIYQNPADTDPIPVQARNIPDFVTQSSNNIVHSQHPEELKQIEDNKIKQIPAQITEFKVNDSKDNIEFKSKISQIPIPTKFTELKVNEIKENIEFKPKISQKQIPAKITEFKVNESKENIEFKPKMSQIMIPAKITDFKVNEKFKLNESKEKNEFKPKKSKIQIPAKITEFKIIDFKDYTGIKSKEAKVFNAKENIEHKPYSKSNLKMKPNEFKLNQFKQNIEVKPKQSKINVEIIPKKLLINNVKEIMKVKASQPNRVNIVREFKTKNLKINEVKKNIKDRAALKPVKSATSLDEIQLKSTDFKTININNNIYSKYKDFKVNEMKESCDIAMAEPCPVITRSVPGLYSLNPGCKKIKGGCSKKKKKEQPKKKCRFKKKRKLPNCDDVKNNRNKCLPLSIPGLEGKPEYSINAPKKTYFKKSDNISNFIDVKEQDISLLANQKQQQKQEFVPFKLKPEFWKK